MLASDMGDGADSSSSSQLSTEKEIHNGPSRVSDDSHRAADETKPEQPSAEDLERMETFVKDCNVGLSSRFQARIHCCRACPFHLSGRS